MHLLIVEDEPEVLSYIAKGMREAGHDADAAQTGPDALSMARGNRYDILIVDRMIPGLDGLSVIKTLRAEGNNTPALILSALGEVDDRVKGLRSGGDDYLVKPFSFAELLARCEILARRGQKEVSNNVTVLTAGDLVLNLLSRTVKRGDVEIELQTREFKLLEYLLRNKGQIVTRTMLLEHVWDYHFDPQTNVIDVHISRLRRKVDKEDSPSSLIQTVRGAGYIVKDE